MKGYKFETKTKKEFVGEVIQDGEIIYLKLNAKWFEVGKFRMLIKKVMPKVVKDKILEFEMKGEENAEKRN